MNFAESYANNRTGFAKKKREDDEYHNGPDPVTRTHKIAFDVSKDGGEKHNRTVTLSNSTKSHYEAKAAAKQHLEKQGYKIHEEAELQEDHLSDYRKYTQAAKNAKAKGDHDIAKDAEEKAKKSAAHYTRVTGKTPTFNEEAELDEATPYYNKPSFLNNMGRIAKQERLAREKKEKEKQTTNRDDKEDMKKESIEMVSFSQFQQEGVMDTLKKVGKKVLDTVGHGDDEAMKKDLQKKMGVPQTGKPSMAKQTEELKGNQHKLDKNKNGKLDAHDFKLLRKEDFELAEETIVEERINHREFASDGHMHPTMANHPAYKAGGGSVDFYAHGTGDKVEGKVTKNDGKQVHIQDTKGKTHKFKVSNTAPHQMKESVEIEEAVDTKKMATCETTVEDCGCDEPMPKKKKMSFKEMMEIYAAPILEGSEDEKADEVAEANAFDWKSGGHKTTGKFDSKSTATGTQYTRKYDAKTGETKDDENEPAVKRGRGRPAGSKTGAAQKGSEKKSDYRGIDRTTHALRLPK